MRKKYVLLIVSIISSFFIFNMGVKAIKWCPGETASVSWSSSIDSFITTDPSCSYSASESLIKCNLANAEYNKSYTISFKAASDFDPGRLTTKSISIVTDTKENCKKDGDDGGSSGGGESSEDNPATGKCYDDNGFVIADKYCRDDCGILGDPNNDKNPTIAFYLQSIFNIIKFLGPILMIIFTIKDLLIVTAEQKVDEELKKIGIRTVKRFVYAVLIFFLPVIISTLFTMIGLYGTCIK